MILKTLATAAFAVTTLIAPLAMHAQLQSKSGEIIVIETRNLPEDAQAGGSSFFLPPDDNGNTYLYVEQQQAHGSPSSTSPFT